jgi:hypothetical protein
MNRKVFTAVAALSAIGAGLAAAVPASAQIEFAVFTPVPSSTGGVVNFKDDGSGMLESVSAVTPTVFAFDLTPLASFGNLAATFNFTASQSGPAVNASGEVEAKFDGSFNYFYNGPTTANGGVTLTHGELLLGGTFTGAAFSGVAGSSGGGLQDDSLTGTVTFTSGLSATDLPLASDGQSFSLDFIDISPILAVQGGDLRHFLTVASGTFSSNLTTGGGGGGIPEPAAWALMLIGLGGVGAVARRRDRRATA